MSNEAILKCEARLFVSFCLGFFSRFDVVLFVVCGQFALHITELKREGKLPNITSEQLLWKTELLKRRYGLHHQDGRTPWYTYNKAFLICIFYCLLISEYVFRRLICLNNIKRNYVILSGKTVYENQKTINMLGKKLYVE